MDKEQILQQLNEYIVIVGGWIISSGLHIILVLLLMLVALKFVGWISHQVFKRVGQNDVEQTKRVETLKNILAVLLRIVVFSLAVMLILGELGINLGPLLATAGVFGLAIGFGAQELVKDVISGFFILLEDQVRVGDVVNLDGKSGVVEKINIRTVILRDLAGNVHYIRNGNIQVVTNMTKGYSRYVFNIGISYNDDVDEAIEVIKQVDAELRSDPQFSPLILEPIEVLGLDEFADSALIIKARTKTIPIKQWEVGREFNRRLKLALDKVGIEIPFPHRTVYLRTSETAN